MHLTGQMSFSRAVRSSAVAYNKVNNQGQGETANRIEMNDKRQHLKAC